MDATAAQIALTPIVIGVVEVFKRVGFNGERWGGVLALALGVGAFLAGALTGAITGASGGRLEPFTAVLTGAVVGLTASGLYSGARAVLGR